jgi:hypothetical protein
MADLGETQRERRLKASRAPGIELPPPAPDMLEAVRDFRLFRNLIANTKGLHVLSTSNINGAIFGIYLMAPFEVKLDNMLDGFG